MRYKVLGKSGLRVSELSLGTMTFGEDWGWGASKEDSRKMFDTYAEAGGNFIDTADRYTNGTSEKFVGEFIAADRENFVVATKYTLSKNPDNPNASGNHRKNMVESLNASLKRLNTDYIDLYWVHAWDFLTPVEEVMRALDDMVRAGKVLYVGVSDTPAWIVSRANAIAELRGWSPFVGLQIEYSLVERTVERDLVPMANALDLAVLAWSPLGGGVLTGKYNREGKDAGRLGQPSERNLQLAEAVMQVAEAIGREQSQVAINWLRAKNNATNAPVIPIIAGSKFHHLEQNLKCLEFDLEPEHVARLDEVSEIDLGFPHRFLKSDGVRRIVFGNHANSIDTHRANEFPGA